MLHGRHISIDLPDIEFLRPCNLCSYMKSITPFGVARSLQDGCNQIEIARRLPAARAVRSGAAGRVGRPIRMQSRDAHVVVVGAGAAGFARR